jgi:phosphoglycerate dehydrogenase-like enzyme
LAKVFGMRVIGIRRSGKAKPYVDEMYKPTALRKLLPRADFVIVCAPDTPESHQMIGRREIALLKRGAGLVNYSRAGLVDYTALRKRLQRGEISAVLDVFSPEPLPATSPLWKTRNLIITPHSSSDDPITYVPRTLDLVLENTMRLYERRQLLNVVHRRLAY